MIRDDRARGEEQDAAGEWTVGSTSAMTMSSGIGLGLAELDAIASSSGLAVALGVNAIPGVARQARSRPSGSTSPVAWAANSISSAPGARVIVGHPELSAPVEGEVLRTVERRADPPIL